MIALTINAAVCAQVDYNNPVMPKRCSIGKCCGRPETGKHLGMAFILSTIFHGHLPVIYVMLWHVHARLLDRVATYTTLFFELRTE